MKKKRLLALVLTIFVALSCVSIPLFAEETIQDVHTAEDLKAALVSGTDAYIRLEGDITFYENITIGNSTATTTKTLYLNGNNLSINNYDINVKYDTTLNIYGGADASDTTQSGYIHNNGSSNNGLSLCDGSPTLNMYSGSINKVSTSADNATVNIYGGSITDSLQLNAIETANIYGGTIFIIKNDDGDGTVNIHDGFIVNFGNTPPRNNQHFRRIFPYRTAGTMDRQRVHAHR